MPAEKPTSPETGNDRDAGSAAGADPDPGGRPTAGSRAELPDDTQADAQADPEIAVQYAVSMPELPHPSDVERWARAALKPGSHQIAELTVRIVDEAESSALNLSYRRKQGSTNVLAFALPSPSPEMADSILGDVVVCAPVVSREAVAQDKPLKAHWAHLVVHGVMHLMGYDHSDAAEAEAMERLEVQTLSELGFADPYGAENHPA